MKFSNVYGHFWPFGFFFPVFSLIKVTVVYNGRSTRVSGLQVVDRQDHENNTDKRTERSKILLIHQMVNKNLFTYLVGPSGPLVTSGIQIFGDFAIASQKL